MHWLAPEDQGPELRKRDRVLAIHYDFVNSSNHFLSVPPARDAQCPVPIPDS